MRQATLFSAISVQRVEQLMCQTLIAPLRSMICQHNVLSIQKSRTGGILWFLGGAYSLSLNHILTTKLQNDTSSAKHITSKDNKLKKDSS